MGNIDILEDACAKLPHTSRKMFGGHGLFAPNGGMFAGIVTDDEIVFKLVDEPTKAELIALGGHPWVYNGKMTMKDWIVIPERFYDEPQDLAAWARRAHALAPGKPPSKKGSPKKGAPKPVPVAKSGKAKPAAPAQKPAAKPAPKPAAKKAQAPAAKKSAVKRPAKAAKKSAKRRS